MRKKEPPHPIRVAKTIDVIARYDENQQVKAKKIFNNSKSNTKFFRSDIDWISFLFPFGFFFLTIFLTIFHVFSLQNNVSFSLRYIFGDIFCAQKMCSQRLIPRVMLSIESFYSLLRVYIYWNIIYILNLWWNPFYEKRNK